MSTKPKWERKHTTRKQVRYPDDLVQAIDDLRGKDSFSSWVIIHLRQAVKRNSKTSGD